MSVEKTLSIIKPDAVKRDLTGKIIAMFEEKGLMIVAQKKNFVIERTSWLFLRRPQRQAFF